MLLLIFTAIFFVAGFFLQVFCRGRVRRFQYLFFVAILGVFGFYLYFVYRQYGLWRDAGPPASFLLPPHQSITYVFGYHFARFGFWYALSLAVAVFTFFAMRALNKKFEERFFEPEEASLAALSVFLLGNPDWRYAWIYYFFALGVVSVLGSLVFRFVPRLSRRFSFYWLWIPTALGVIIGMNVIPLISNI